MPPRAVSSHTSPSADGIGRDAAYYRRQLEAVANNATLALFIMDERQHCTYMNPAAEVLTGFKLEQVQDRPLHDCVHHTRPDGSRYPIDDCPIDRVFPQNMPEQGEEVFVHADGHFYPVSFTARPILEEGRPVGTIIEARDVGDERRAMEELERARAVLDGFFENAPVGAALIDRQLRYIRINRFLATLHGDDPAELEGRAVFEVLPQYKERLEPVFRKVFETGQPVRNLEINGSHPSDPGREAHFLVSYFPVELGGRIAAIALVALDITDRKRAEEARREDTRIVETLHQVGQSLTSELDLERTVQAVTDAATSLTAAQFGAFFYNVRSEDGEVYTLYALSGVEKEAFAGFPMPRNTPVFGPTFHGTGVVRSDDITQDPRYGRMSPYHGMPPGHLPVKSYLAVPVVSRSGDVLGGLFFGHADTAAFRERHERLAVGIAAWAAVALDNAKLYEAEHRARAEAERANRVKSDFLATMSHELRTPLNAMIGYSDLLLEGVPEPLPERAREKVSRIALSAQHLLSLIEEVLTFSRLEANEERVETEPTDIWVLLEEVHALAEPLALAKDISLRIPRPVELPRFESDRRKVKQILLNLVGNAIKFTDEGSVVLEVEAIDGQLLFRVRDTGSGIGGDHMEDIFRPFWQMESGPTRRAGGTGLGLSVSRRLARLMGGDVTVESRPAQGSTFSLSLPLREG